MLIAYIAQSFQKFFHLFQPLPYEESHTQKNSESTVDEFNIVVFCNSEKIRHTDFAVVFVILKRLV